MHALPLRLLVELLVVVHRTQNLYLVASSLDLTLCLRRDCSTQEDGKEVMKINKDYCFDVNSDATTFCLTIFVLLFGVMYFANNIDGMGFALLFGLGAFGAPIAHLLLHGVVWREPIDTIDDM